MVFFCLAIAVCAIVIHLYSLHAEWQITQSVSKAFLIPSMTLLLFVALNESGRVLSESSLILLPAFFYTCGDILLEFKKKSCCFYIGAVSFIFGHLAYSFFFLTAFEAVHTSLAIWAVIWSICFLFVYRHVSAYGHKETPLQFLYIFFVLVMGVSLGWSGYNGILYAKLIGMAGAFLFAFSDLMIVMQRIKETEKYEMAIMVTYIGANALILLSLFLASSRP